MLGKEFFHSVTSTDSIIDVSIVGEIISGVKKDISLGSIIGSTVSDDVDKDDTEKRSVYSSCCKDNSSSLNCTWSLKDEIRKSAFDGMHMLHKKIISTNYKSSRNKRYGIAPRRGTFLLKVYDDARRKNAENLYAKYAVGAIRLKKSFRVRIVL